MSVNVKAKAPPATAAKKTSTALIKPTPRVFWPQVVKAKPVAATGFSEVVALWKCIFPIYADHAQGFDAQLCPSASGKTKGSFTMIKLAHAKNIAVVLEARDDTASLDGSSGEGLETIKALKKAKPTVFIVAHTTKFRAYDVTGTGAATKATPKAVGATKAGTDADANTQAADLETLLKAIAAEAAAGKY